MALIIIALLGFSLILFVLSFFQKDAVESVRDELEQFTIQQVQENYQMKKKIKILEEELLIGDENFTFSSNATKEETLEKKDIHEIIKNQVRALASQGKPIEQIASQASLSVNDVYEILQDHAYRRTNNG